MIFPSRASIAKTVIEVLASVKPRLIYGFGSAFQGAPRADSDVDIAYLPSGNISSLENFRLAQEAAVHLGRDVDFISLREANAVLKAQILKTGELLFSSDDHFRHEFEMYALSDYARLNEERRPVLDRVREEGTVYGP